MREVSRVPEHVRMARECHLRGLTQALDHPAEPHGTHWGFPVRAYWGFPLRLATGLLLAFQTTYCPVELQTTYCPVDKRA
jgi:hypothetical protein